MSTPIQVYQHAVSTLPLTGLAGHFYYIKNGSGTDLDEYLADNLGVLRFIGTRPSNTISYTSGETIPSYTPIAIYNNLAYKLDASNINHQFAFVGFSKNGTIAGQICLIQQIGELELIGWGLTPNIQYLAGTSGAITTNNITPGNFTKVIGYTITSNKLQIIKDYTTVK